MPCNPCPTKHIKPFLSFITKQVHNQCTYPISILCQILHCQILHWVVVDTHAHTHPKSTFLIKTTSVYMQDNHRKFPSDTNWRLIYPTPNREGPLPYCAIPSTPLPQPTHKSINRVKTRLLNKWPTPYPFIKTKFHKISTRD